MDGVGGGGTGQNRKSLHHETGENVLMDWSITVVIITVYRLIVSCIARPVSRNYTPKRFSGSLLHAGAMFNSQCMSDCLPEEEEH